MVKKIKTAVTDSGKEIIFDPKHKPALANLLTMYHLFSGREIKEIEKIYEGKGYAEFKFGLAEVINDFLEPIRRAREEFSQDKSYLALVLREGTERASAETEAVMKKARSAMRYDYKNIFHPR